MAAGDYWEMTLNWECATWGSGEAHNVLHYRQETADDLDPEEFAALAADWFTTTPSGGNPPNGLYKDDVSIASISLRKINPISPLIQVGTTDLPVAGLGTGDSLPDQCAFLLSTRTAFSGRRYRGRHYLPAMAENTQQGGLWTFTGVDLIAQSWLDFFATGAAGLTGSPSYVVYSEVLAAGENVTACRADTRVRRIGKRQARAPLYA